MAQRRHDFQGHVAGALDNPFIVLLEQKRAAQANDGVLVREYADHLRPTLDLAVGGSSREVAFLAPLGNAQFNRSGGRYR
ncbi:hypothetical protein ACVWWG_001860 [Bradyrhizobium sp. LB7.2]